MKKKLTIIIYNGSFHLPTFVYQLGAQLTKKGHHVTFMGQSDTCFAYSKGQMHYYPLPYTDQTLWLLLKSWLMALQLVFKRPLALPGIWRTLKADYHKNKGKKGRKNWVMDFIRLGACQLIKPDVIHNQWSTGLPALEPLFEYYPIIQSLHGKLEELRPYYNLVTAESHKKFFPKLSGVQSASNKALEHAQYFGLQTENIWLSYSPVNKSWLNQTNSHKELLPTKNNPLKILSCGRLTWKKGFSWALEALSNFKTHFNHFQYQIIGSGDHSEILFNLKDLNLENHVTLMNAMSPKNVFEKMEEADIFLVSSIQEGFPTVLSEALAKGKFVITTNCGGISEIIEHKKHALLVPSMDSKAINNALLEYLEMDTVSIQKIRQKGEELASNFLIWENQIDKLELVYQKALQ